MKGGWSDRSVSNTKNKMKVKRMQCLGNEAIKIQIPPSKPKREITKITNSLNTKKTYNQPSEQLFPKRWPLNPNHNMTTGEVKRHRTLTPKTGKREYHNRTTTLERSVMYYWGLKHVLRRQPYPQFLKWYKAFSWWFSSHDNLLTRQ